MAEFSLWHDGQDTGDAGVYDAAEIRAFFRRIIGHDADDEATRGVLLGVENDLEVVPSSPAAKSVVVRSGAALVYGSPYYNTADLTLDVDANTSGYDRVDRVVLELDFAAKTVRARIVKGAEDGSDAPAALVQNASYWQIPIARIDCDNGYSTITEAEIIDDRFYANLPPVVAVEMTNNGGSEIDVGTVVVHDAGVDRGVNTSTTVGDPNVAGVVIDGRIPVSASGKVAVVGPVQMKVTGAVGRGNRLRQSATAGRAEAAPTGAAGFAIALTANASGDGMVWALFERGGVEACVVTRAGNYALSSSFAPVTWDSEVSDTVNMFTSGTAVYARVAGFYVITAAASGVTVDNGTFLAGRLVINAATEIGRDADHYEYNAAGVELAASPGAVRWLNAGDYVQLQLQRGTYGVTLHDAWLSVARLGTGV